MLDLFRAALERVDGRAAVARALSAEPPQVCAAIAVGKAAEAMMSGAIEVLGPRLLAGLMITKAGHVDPLRWRASAVTVMESAHPVPDARSLAAGRALLDFLERLPDDLPLLVLISGGTSALVEIPRADVTLDDLGRANTWLLASGLPIDAVNRVRGALSSIKAGGLLAHTGPRPVRGLLMSDVPGDDSAVIGSGLLVPNPPGELPALPDWLEALVAAVPSPAAPSAQAVRLELVATLQDALSAAEARARALDLAVWRHPEFLAGDAAARGMEIGAYLCTAPRGLHLWGGETTVVLPPAPGRGGRNQQFALALAGRLAGRDDVLCLAAGTDGTDGPTEDAGALVDGATWQRASDGGVDPAAALAGADAGRALEASGDLIQTGPTGTNVMDVVIAYKGEPGLTDENLA